MHNLYIDYHNYSSATSFFQYNIMTVWQSYSAATLQLSKQLGLVSVDKLR